jgi:predicted HicB family RNase H-like nuclease
MLETQNTKGTFIRVRIEDEIKAAAREAAQRKGRSLSQHVRELLRDDVERQAAQRRTQFVEVAT